MEDADFDGLFCHPENDAFAFYRRSRHRPMRSSRPTGATAEEAAAAIADLTAFAADPETVIGSPRTFQLWARRPDA